MADAVFWKCQWTQCPVGFPTCVSWLYFINLQTRLTKILQMKRKKVRELKDMNTEAEKTVGYLICIVSENMFHSVLMIK